MAVFIWDKKFHLGIWSRIYFPLHVHFMFLSYFIFVTFSRIVANKYLLVC